MKIVPHIKSISETRILKRFHSFLRLYYKNRILVKLKKKHNLNFTKNYGSLVNVDTYCLSGRARRPHKWERRLGRPNGSEREWSFENDIDLLLLWRVRQDLRSIFYSLPVGALTFHQKPPYSRAFYLHSGLHLNISCLFSPKHSFITVL